MDWEITIGDFKLALLESCEVHKSVDLLADTCKIVLPEAAYNQSLKIEAQINRGDKVLVKLGYNNNLVKEFEGYLLNINTDSGNLTLNFEDDLFLMRKGVKDKEFVKSSTKQIAQYLVDAVGAAIKVECSLNMDYDKFVISKSTAYDVLKKIQEETKANIYLKNGALHIHPPYLEKFGSVRYSFQQNIESSDLKYVRKDQTALEVIVTSTGKDGKKKQARFGNSKAGDKVTLDGYGLTEASMKQKAETAHNLQLFDGYEGSVSTWLIPYVEPGYSAEIIDEDYEYKNGWYYVTAVTTTFSSSGGVRKTQLGKKLVGNG